MLDQTPLNKLTFDLFANKRRRRNREPVSTEVLETRQLLTADFQLVADLNKVDIVARGIGESVVMGGVLYFAGETAGAGLELWKSDGTDAGTRLVTSIASGPSDSSPTDFLVVGSTLYFTADDGVHGRELWKTDGTPGGTSMVKDIAVGAGDSNPQSLTNANGVLYFSAHDGVNGRELWKSNGVSSGTVMVRNLNTAPNESGVPDGSEIVAVGNTVFFPGNTLLTGTELFKSDGTSAGTVLVRDISNPGLVLSPQGSEPTQLTKIGTQVYFVAQTQNGLFLQTGLWVTNGTVAGTGRIDTDSEFNAVTAVGTNVYYEARGSLFRTSIVNGVIVPVLLKQDIGTVSSIKQSGGITYVVSQAENNTARLWRTNGTSSGTVELDQFFGATNVENNVPTELTDWNGTLYFRVFSDQIWTSGGTFATTTGQIDLPNGNPGILGATSSTLFLSGGDVLLRSNGTAAGTEPVQTVKTFGSVPSNLVALNDKLLFTADDGVAGNELRFIYDDFEGSSTLPLIDVFPGPESSSPSDLTVFRNFVYFAATKSVGRKLWRTDGTESGTTQVEPNLLRSSSNPESLTVVGNALYFTATSLLNGRELWRVDNRGNAGLVKDIRPGATSSEPQSLVAVGDRLYFSADNGTNGRELWTSDGTTAGTRMVVDLRPGKSGAEPKYLTAVGGRVFFQARNASSGYELFSSSGTADRTILVKDIHPTLSSSPNRLTNVGGILYFSANDPTTGRELWKSDGTNAGTTRVSDIAPGAANSLPNELTNVNGTLFFQATSGSGDVELWKSNGTPATTVPVLNINTAGSSSPIGLTNIAGYLYFSATTASNGRELWRSDGTSTGTVLWKNFAAGNVSSNPAGIVRVQDRLYVSAITDTLGRELYVDDLFDQTVGNDAYITEYVPSASGNSVRILKGAARGAAILLATLPATEPVEIRSLAGVDSITIRGTVNDDTFNVSLFQDVFSDHDVEVALNESLVQAIDFSSYTLAGSSGSDNYRFDETVVNSPDKRAFRILESGTGTDTLDLSKLSSRATVNLQLTTPQQVSSVLNLQLLSGSGVENVIGSPFNDVLTGNTLANVINGGTGDDTIDGGDGNDTISAGAGNDIITGGRGSDVLTGGIGNDVYLFGDATTAETDVVTELATEGIDTISFGTVTSAITFGLGLSTPQSVHLNRTLTLNAIDAFENAVGGSGNDVLTGNALSNELTGGQGDDTMSGGLGDDVYIFANSPTAESDLVNELIAQGRDTLSFADVTSNVTLGIGITTPQTVHANRTLKLNSPVEFENATGGSGHDTLTGNNRNNVLIGNAGNDELLGLGGRDILIGGLNFDSLDGGSDEDILIAGVTDFDKIYSDLNLLMVEWGSVDPIATRITKLRTGVGPKPIALKAGTSVKDDNGQLDELTGSGALDWFFRDLTDLVSDLNGEVIDEL